MTEIKLSDVQPGETVRVRGKITFSRLARLIEGVELAKRIADSKSNFPTTDPHTTVTVGDAQVVFVDPQNPTPAELYAQQKLFRWNIGKNANRVGFSIDNTSPYLPTILEMDPAGGYRQLILERDLAQDLDITLDMGVFISKKTGKMGLGLNNVILNEPARYYGSAAVDNTAALAARGIVVNGPIQRIAGVDSPAAASADQVEEALPANSQIGAYGLAMPAPGAMGTPPQQFQQQAPQPPQAPQFQEQPPAAAYVPQPAPVPVPEMAGGMPQMQPVQQAFPQQPVLAQHAPQGAPAQSSQDDEVQRLRQLLAEKEVAMAAAGGASAFDGGAQPVPPTPGVNPWDVTGPSAETFSG